MRIPESLGLFFMRTFILPAMYIGSPAGREILWRDRGVQFVARRGSMDVLVLHEMFKRNSYGHVNLERGMSVVDIGAHIGAFSVYAAKRGCRVFAYEPEPHNYGMLLRNIEMNGVHVSAHNKAVWKENCYANLGVSSLGNALHSLKQIASVKGLSRVRCVSLAKVMADNELRRIDVLKIDVEGAEYEILAGAKPYLKKVNTIVLEYHLGKGYALSSLLQVLSDAGFSVKEVTKGIQKITYTGILLARRRPNSRRVAG